MAVCAGASVYRPSGGWSVSDRVGGTWVFRGTRLPVATVIENLEDLSVNEVIEQIAPRTLSCLQRQRPTRKRAHTRTKRRLPYEAGISSHVSAGGRYSYALPS